MFAQLLGVTKQLCDSPDNRKNLIPADEGVQSRSQIRLGGEPAAHAQPEANLRLPAQDTLDRSQADIVDLRIRAPDAAARDGNLELAREVVELGIAREHSIRFEGKR